MKHFAIVSLLLFVACSSNDSISDTGTLTGTMVLYGGADYAQLNDASGITATLLGTSFSANTNAAGVWTIKNVPAGIYTVQLTKPGFDSIIFSKHHFTGAGTDIFDSLSLLQLPDCRLHLHT